MNWSPDWSSNANYQSTSRSNTTNVDSSWILPEGETRANLPSPRFEVRDSEGNPIEEALCIGWPQVKYIRFMKCALHDAFNCRLCTLRCVIHELPNCEECFPVAPEEDMNVHQRKDIFRIEDGKMLPVKGPYVVSNTYLACCATSEFEKTGTIEDIPDPSQWIEKENFLLRQLQEELYKMGTAQQRDFEKQFSECIHSEVDYTSIDYAKALVILKDVAVRREAVARANDSVKRVIGDGFIEHTGSIDYIDHFNSDAVEEVDPEFLADDAPKKKPLYNQYQVYEDPMEA